MASGKGLMTRKKVMAANWKMYKGPEQTKAFSATSYRWWRATPGTKSWSVLPTLIFMSPSRPARDQMSPSARKIFIGKKQGAYTGEICPAMLLEMGCTHVDHRPFRTPPVFRRNRRHGELQAEGCPRGWTDSDRLRRRGFGGARSQAHRRRAAAAVPARLSCHLSQEGGKTDRRLRTGMGDRDRKDGHAATRVGASSSVDSRRGRQSLRRGVRSTISAFCTAVR